MKNDIQNMVKIGLFRVLLQTQKDFLLSMRYNFEIIGDFNDSELDKIQGLTVLINAGS